MEIEFGLMSFKRKKRDMGGDMDKNADFQHGELNLVWSISWENDILTIFRRCARLLLQKSVTNMYGCDPTENVDLEHGTCIHMVTKNVLKKNILYISGYKTALFFILRRINYPIGNFILWSFGMEASTCSARNKESSRRHKWRRDAVTPHKGVASRRSDDTHFDSVNWLLNCLRIQLAMSTMIRSPALQKRERVKIFCSSLIAKCQQMVPKMV